MRMPIPLDELLKAYHIVKELENYIREQKQRLIFELIEGEEMSKEVLATYRASLRTLKEIERTIEHASYEAEQQKEDMYAERNA